MAPTSRDRPIAVIEQHKSIGQCREGCTGSKHAIDLQGRYESYLLFERSREPACPQNLRVAFDGLKSILPRPWSPWIRQTWIRQEPIDTTEF